MCLQITYTLPCEHVRTEIIYCTNATMEPSSSLAGGSSSKKHDRSGGSSKSKGSSSQSSQSSSHKSRHKPCSNLTLQSLPYPTPPSFEGDPQMAASSLLAPKCPLLNCPFEAKKRCWNCCSCGKGWNEKGRCGCIMLVDGSLVQCGHVCCQNCESALP